VWVGAVPIRHQETLGLEYVGMPACEELSARPIQLKDLGVVGRKRCNNVSTATCLYDGYLYP